MVAVSRRRGRAGLPRRQRAGIGGRGPRGSECKLMGRNADRGSLTRDTGMGSINLIARDNGFGLSRDLRLLAIALAARGHEVTLSPRRRGKLRKIFGPWKPRLRVVARRLRGLDTHEFDANLMLEHVR